MALVARTILVGYDGSTGARLALERAADLAGYGSTIDVVAVGAPAAVIAEARAALESRHVVARTREAVGNPAVVLAAEAEAASADLIVVGSRGTGTPRGPLGSVAAALVDRAPCDVLVVRAPATDQQEEEEDMNTFLIATDGSPAAEAAVDAGVELAVKQGARALFLHVVETLSPVSPLFGPIQAAPADYGEPEDDPPLARAAAVAAAHGVPYELRLVPGFDVDVVLEVAEEVDAELIAVGSNRHGAIGTALLGSVSTELLRRARRPVLVVHPTAAQAEAAAAAR